MIACVAKLTLVAVLSTSTVHPATYQGFAASYRPGLMERVARNRGMAPARCMAASFRLPLGRWVRVLGQRTGAQRWCKVVDICHPRDCGSIRARGIVTELDYQSNRAICGAPDEPPSSCKVTVLEGSTP